MATTTDPNATSTATTPTTGTSNVAGSVATDPTAAARYRFRKKAGFGRKQSAARPSKHLLDGMCSQPWLLFCQMAWKTEP